MRGSSHLQLVVDIETTPVPADRRKFPHQIHCIAALDIHTGAVYEAGPSDLDNAVAFIRTADRLIGHNLARFDLPCLEERFGFRYEGEVFDTYSAAQMVYASNLIEYTARIARTQPIPKELWKSHKLEVWGLRLGLQKLHADVGLEFFASWSRELAERCRSDLRLTAALYEHLSKPAAFGWPANPESVLLLESQVAYMIGHQERNGVGFDSTKAALLFAELHAKREELQTELQALVQPWLFPVGKSVTPKRSRTATKGLPWPVQYTEGAEYQRIKRVEFNAASCQHRAWALEGHTPGPSGYGWKPTKFTGDGLPVTDEETLVGLDYPVVPLLRDYLTVNKRLGQLSDGTHAWTRKEVNGRIHGAVHVTGTRTSRAAHFSPNLGQVPSRKSEYGPECRELFTPTGQGWVQVGIDAKGLELRLFANRLSRYDGGSFIKTVLTGDPHAAFMLGTLIFIRDFQKEWTYALLYGAGNERLGMIILGDWRKAYEKGLTDKPPPSTECAEGLGRISRERLLKTFGALDDLLNECRQHHARGWFAALDGRILACPSAHGALNDLLQSDGAIVVKHAMPIWYRELTRRFGPHGGRWAQMLWVHDEWQLECEPEVAEELGQVVCGAVQQTTEILKLACPMDGEFKIGKNWRETH